MALLEMFINGEVITEETVLPKIQGRVKATVDQLVEAMDGKLSIEDRFLLGQSLEHYRHLVNQVEEITAVIKQYVLERFEREYSLLIELPGVSAIVACVILSEIGPNVEAFQSQGNLASWAGVCPGSYESAGIKKSSHTTQGNKYLKSSLFQAGGTAGRSKDEAFHNLYARISGRSSKMKAIIACAHKLIRIIYKILSTGEHYDAKKALGLRQQARAN